MRRYIETLVVENINNVLTRYNDSLYKYKDAPGGVVSRDTVEIRMIQGRMQSSWFLDSSSP